MKRLIDDLVEEMHLGNYGGPICSSSCGHDHHPPIKFENKREISLDLCPMKLENHVIFTLPSQLGKNENWPIEKETGDSIIKRLPANLLIEMTESRDILSGRVVFLGSTHNDNGGDWLWTPFGMMPGVFVIINAINKVVNIGMLKTIDHIDALIIEALISFFASILIVFLPHSRLTTLIMISVFIFIIHTLGVYLSGYGIWIDLVAPPVSAFIHHKIIHLWMHHRRAPDRSATEQAVASS